MQVRVSHLRISSYLADLPDDEMRCAKFLGMMRLMRLAEDGYEIEETGLSNQECDACIAALSNARRSRAGARHLMKYPAVAQLAADPRLLAMVQAILGEMAVAF